VVEYMELAQPVIRKLLEVPMKGLNVDKIDEGTENMLMGRLAVNLNCYPKCPNPEVTDGVGPRADVSTITVLLQDDIGGLYV
ncbi:2OG-Fe(II) oxygenase family protein, partial [Klebsiella pneumoniae]|uniref:2OG-Fe(II) oxygenase family protein n=1 Tax=Klebsiella pneumoniae TaxID=573 RepID=UPI00272F40E6